MESKELGQPKMYAPFLYGIRCNFDCKTREGTSKVVYSLNLSGPTSSLQPALYNLEFQLLVRELTQTGYTLLARPWLRKNKGSCAVKVKINVPVDEAWKLLGDWQGLEKCLQHLGEVTVEILEGENNVVNSVRGVNYLRPDRSRMFSKERLLTLDEKHHTCTYQLLGNSFRFSFLVGTLMILDGGDDTSVVHWSAKFDLDEGYPIEEGTSLVTELYIGICKQAEKVFIERMAPAATPATAPVSAA